MSVERVSLVFEAELSALRAELATVPGVSAKEAKKITAAFVAQMKDTERAAKRSIEVAAKAGQRMAAEAEKTADRAKEGMFELADAAGLPADTVKKLQAGLGALANPATLAAVAVGGIGLAAAGAVAGMVALTRAGAEAGKALGPLRQIEGFGGLPPQAQASLDRANAALDAVGSQGLRLAEILAGQVAPTVERVAFVAVKLGLAVLDGANAASEAGGVFKSLAGILVGVVARSLAEPITRVAALAEAMGELAKVAGATELGGRLSDLGRRWRTFTDGLIDIPLDLASAGLDRVSASLADYDARAKALIGVEEKLNRETVAVAKRVEAEKRLDDTTQKRLLAEVAALRAAGEAQAQVAALELQVAQRRADQSGLLADRIAAIELEGAAAKAAAEEQYRALVRAGEGRAAAVLLAEQEAQISEDTQRRIRDAEQATEDARLAAHQAQLARLQEQSQGAVGAAQAAAQAVANAAAWEAQETQENLDRIRAAREALGEDITRAQAKRLRAAEEAEQAAAVKAWRISQAASLATATVQGYQAILSALTLGPIAGPIAAAAMAAAVATQVGAIASASPPTFHRGGIVDGGPRASADPSERVAVVRAGEGVLTRQGVESAGGKAGLDALNRGEGGNGTTIVHLQLARRTLQQVAVAASGMRAGPGRRNPHTKRVLA